MLVVRRMAMRMQRATEKWKPQRERRLLKKKSRQNEIAVKGRPAQDTTILDFSEEKKKIKAVGEGSY